MSAGKFQEILCDESTYRACSPRFSFKELAPIKVKGKENYIKVYVPRADDQQEEEEVGIQSYTTLKFSPSK